MSIGTGNSEPIRIGFLVGSLVGWTGGKNYLRNLLVAIDSIEEKRIEPYLFINTSIDEEFLESIKPYVNLIDLGILFRVNVPFLKRIKPIEWLREQILYKRIDRLKIAVMSHANIYGKGQPFHTVNWIPDFQHLYLPEMFSPEECKKRSNVYQNIIRGGDAVILSSNRALKDAKKFSPGYEKKLYRLSFVPALDEEKLENSHNILALEKKYGFSGYYFYLPNQFWRHKNHIAVFRAVKYLKEKGTELLVLCSGDMSDYRNDRFVNELKSFLEDNQLGNNIKLLGRIPYIDVLGLFQFSIAVINPSFFEGWSSTVEEAKALGKKLIISNIEVHQEQNPDKVDYFDPEDTFEIANILEMNWNNFSTDSVFTKPQKIKDELKKLKAQFGETYQDIIQEVVNR